jgi:tetratricopeptide (TPR) repeat protein
MTTPMARLARPSPPPGPAAATLPAAAWFGLLLLAALVAYGPALRGELLWDDAGHVTAPALRSLDGLYRIWLEPGATQQYYPLLHSAFWVEHRLWGDAVLGYHLVNVLQHALAATLFGLLLRRLSVSGAWLAAFVFLLHPVCVESVAWISEQKNTLSTVLALAAALAWLRFEDDRRPSCYAAATLWFVAALLAKTVTATLPAALLVIAWWRRGRLSWLGDVLPLSSWLLLGAVAGVGTAWVEAHGIGAQGGDFALGPVERVLLAGRVAWSYFGKLIWPADLAFFYPRWTIDAATWWQWLFPLAGVLVLAGATWWSRRDRGPLAAVLLFGGTLFPVLGFVNVYPFVFSYVADHFQYLASLTLIAFLTAAAVRGSARLRGPAWSGPLAAGALLLLLGSLSWRQAHMYRDVFSLYETTLARNPNSWVAHLNLGTALDDAGRPVDSLAHLQRALELKPDFPETLNSLASVLNQLGRAAEARPLLERALRLQPRFAAAHNTLGVTLMMLGRTAEGVESFRHALALAPDAALTHANLAWALAQSGRGAEALVEFAAAQRRHPDEPDIEFKWGLALAQQGHLGEAIPHLARAVGLQPDNPDSRFVLGGALWQAGRPREAALEFEATLRLNPDHAGARQALEGLGQRR